MNPWTIKRLLWTIAISVLIWLALASCCLMLGTSTTTKLPTIGSEVFRERLHLTLLASLVGAALASAGVVYQALLRNPLADPYLLGVSSGASLAAFVWQLPSITAIITLGDRWMLGQQGVAFAGAVISMLVVFALAGSRGKLEPVTLLLVGVIVNSINGSIFLFLNAIYRDVATPGGPVAFLVGGLQQSLQTRQILVAAGCIGIGWIAMMYLSGQLNATLLSEGEAASLGVHVQSLRWIGLIVASLITASAVAISGPIGFVGLVCPHLARLIVGNDQRKLLPLATALGAGLLALADALARALYGWHKLDTVVPVGVVTGLLGGPFFLLLLWQTRRKAASA